MEEKVSIAIQESVVRAGNYVELPHGGKKKYKKAQRWTEKNKTKQNKTTTTTTTTTTTAKIKKNLPPEPP